MFYGKQGSNINFGERARDHSVRLVGDLLPLLLLKSLRRSNLRTSMWTSSEEWAAISRLSPGKQQHEPTCLVAIAAISRPFRGMHSNFRNLSCSCPEFYHSTSSLDVYLIGGSREKWGPLPELLRIVHWKCQGFFGLLWSSVLSPEDPCWPTSLIPSCCRCGCEITCGNWLQSMRGRSAQLS